MEFRTRLVIRQRNKRAYVAYAGLIIAACALPVYFIPPIQDYYPYVFGVGIAVVIIGAVIAGLLARWMYEREAIVETVVVEERRVTP